MKRVPAYPLLTAVFMLAVPALASDSAAPSVAETRPEMKQRIEGLKDRTSRLPLPPLTAEEIAAGRSSVNNGRLRSIYLPASWQKFAISGWSGRTSRSSRTRPATTSQLLNSLQANPDYGFNTRLFWIVSRANDCQYCLGHQELKLHRVGMTEDQVAALDSKWEQFPEKEQAAFELTRRLTLTPHLWTEQDLSALKPHFKDREIIEMVYTVAQYNSVNRWTASTGIPQDRSFGSDEPSQLDTPTSPEFANVPSIVAPLNVAPRPEWEPIEEFMAQLATARTRVPGVKLPDVSVARQALAVDTPGVTPPVWVQAIADQSVALDAWRIRQALARDGNTDHTLRAMIAWVTARENRALYAAAHARLRCLASGVPADSLKSFDAITAAATEPGHADALRFARKLTSAPHTIVDSDIVGLQSNFTDHEVAELIQLTAESNSFDRYTEALGLPVEDLPEVATAAN